MMDALFQRWRGIGWCYLVALTVERFVLQILQPSALQTDQATLHTRLLLLGVPCIDGDQGRRVMH